MTSIYGRRQRKACRVEGKGYGSYHISVNISTKDFYIIDIYETFTGLINKYGIAASNLHLEITETTLMTDFEKNMNIIHKLQGVGFRVEIDDFGSGYSSLNMLKDISADVLKIDMGFLRKSENEVKGQDILESIITLAGKIGMDVITEGVETKKQLDMLTMMGCHEFQGYYFSNRYRYLSLKKSIWYSYHVYLLCISNIYFRYCAKFNTLYIWGGY